MARGRHGHEGDDAVRDRLAVAGEAGEAGGRGPCGVVMALEVWLDVRVVASDGAWEEHDIAVRVGGRCRL